MPALRPFALFRTHDLWLRASHEQTALEGEVVPVPILCSVTFGAPLQVAEGEERRPFLDRARQAVMALRDV